MKNKETLALAIFDQVGLCLTWTKPQKTDFPETRLVLKDRLTVLLLSLKCTE